MAAAASPVASAAAAAAADSPDSNAACFTPSTAASNTSLYPPYAEYCIPALEAKYIVGREIGRGSCSVVREVTHRGSGQVYVAKFCSTQDTAYNPEEGEITMSARHDHIVQGVDVFKSATHAAIVLEDLRSGGELFHLVKHNGAASSSGGGLSEPQAAAVIHGVLSALHYLHDVLGVVHRDVKLENIMLLIGGHVNDDHKHEQRGGGSGDHHHHRPLPDLSDATVKLIDFGFSKRIGYSKSLNACCGSPNYMSPEMLRSSRTQDHNATLLPTRHQPYGNEVDMWATGVLLYVVLVGRYPFYHERRSVWHKSILLGQFHPIPSTMAISSQARDLLSRLLSVRAEDRLSAEEALNHPWFHMQNHGGGDAVAVGGSGGVPRRVASEMLATPPRKRTPPTADAAAARSPHSGIAAFTPPHNHALFMETPLGKATGRGGGDYSSPNSAIL